MLQLTDSHCRQVGSVYCGIGGELTGVFSFQLVVKTESLHLVGATWTCSTTVRPNGTVCQVWKHRLPDPAPVGAPAIFDMYHQQLFSPDWSAGLRGNQSFVCAAVNAVHKIKVNCPLCNILPPSTDDHCVFFVSLIVLCLRYAMLLKYTFAPCRVIMPSKCNCKFKLR